MGIGTGIMAGVLFGEMARSKSQSTAQAGSGCEELVWMYVAWPIFTIVVSVVYAMLKKPTLEDNRNSYAFSAAIVSSLVWCFFIVVAHAILHVQRTS